MLSRVLTVEIRPDLSRRMAYLSPLFALAITVVIGMGLFAAIGKNPFESLEVYFIEPLRGMRSISELLLKSTPIILCALGLVGCYRANIWNIGAEGQLIAGAIAAGATLIALDNHHVDLSAYAALAIVTVAGIAGGAFWASLVAMGKDWFNANEILVSLMLTYVAQLAMVYAVNGPLKDPGGMNFPQSQLFSASLPIIWPGTRLHAGFAVALVCCAVVTWLISKTFLGYRLRTQGLAPAAARYAGFSGREALWVPLLLSGALAGMAGAYEVAGPIGQLLPSISPGYGFAAIIVVFIGRLHPVGAVFGGLIMSLMYLGGDLAQSRLGMPSSITGIFQGLLLLSLLATDLLISYRLKWSV
ncbi:nucleoside ABC transporter membrane protein [Burkholderia sp. GAS332]|nr:nucleoside ABC transporter membrane protein [Burkholderia sp. GAS332]